MDFERVYKNIKSILLDESLVLYFSDEELKTILATANLLFKNGNETVASKIADYFMEKYTSEGKSIMSLAYGNQHEIDAPRLYSLILNHLHDIDSIKERS